MTSVPHPDDALRDLPYRHRGDLTTGPVQRHLLRLSIPMVWAMLAVISVQLVDVYFLSMLGKTELTGISFTFPVTTLISHLTFGFNVAMSSVASRMIGAGKHEDARRIALHGIALSFAVSCLIALAFYAGLQGLFRDMGADENSMRVVNDYMPTWLIGSAILAIAVNSNAATRAAGDTFLPSIILIGVAVINLALAPFLVFGLLGFPRLEVFGAALATVIAYGCGAGAAFYVAAFRKKLVALDGLHRGALKDSLKRLLVIAVPASIGSVITPAMNAVLTAMLARYGADAVAAYGIASRVEAFAMIAVIALALGMAPLVGQNWGAGRYERVHETIRLSIFYNFLWSFFVAVVFAVFDHPIGRAFTTDPAIINLVTLYFWIIPITYGLGNLVFGWSSAFNAMGLPQYSFFMIAVKSFLLTLPAAYVAGKFFGPVGLFAAVALVNVASGIAFHYVSRGICERREKKRLANI